MNRRTFLHGSAGAPLLAQANGGKPLNFLFLMSDDHTARDLGAYGNRAVQSPHLDKLAREGMRFERCFVSSPQCSPNRTSLFTGCTPHTTATSRLHVPLPDWEPTIIDALKEKGYYNGVYRKHHLGPGFQRRLDFYGDARTPFKNFFEAKPKDKPFWLQIGFTDPHRPYRPGAFSPPHDPAKVEVPNWLPDWPEVRQDLAYYYDFIGRMDQEVGQLMDLLAKQGHAQDTMVIFTGDNGMPFPRAKGTLYDPGLHVPLLAWMPGTIQAGSVRSEMIAHVDLPSMWLDAAGIPQGKKMQGKSFLPLLLGQNYQPRKEIFGERNWHDMFDPMRCVRTEQHKLILNANPHFPYRPPADIESGLSWQTMLSKRRNSTPFHLRHLFNPTRPVLELFDLKQDSMELENLIDSPKHLPIRKDLEFRLSKWMNDTYDFLPASPGTSPEKLDRSWPFAL